MNHVCHYPFQSEGREFVAQVALCKKIREERTVPHGYPFPRIVYHGEDGACREYSMYSIERVFWCGERTEQRHRNSFVHSYEARDK